MNRIFIAAVLALPLSFAQQPAAPAQGGRGGARGGNANANSNLPSIMAIRENPSNQDSGVDIDRFIGYPTGKFMKIFNGLNTRSMLRNGDPYHPGPSGNVLEYRTECAVATLEPHFQTGTADSPEIFFYYVQDGVGTVDSGPGTQSFPVHTGVGVLFAPGTKQHFVNTGDKQLSMIMLAWKDNDGLTVKQPIKVVDTTGQPFNGGNTLDAPGTRVHWNMMGKSMFNTPDGINTSLGAIYVPPLSYTGPHAHIPGVEELWIKTGSDMNYALLGSEIRVIEGNGAFVSPPNNKTTHSQMNPSPDHPSVWLFVSHHFTEKNVHPELMPKKP